MLVSSWVGESNIVLVAVQDSGTGLDSDSLNHIFEAFHTTKPNGAGIRLAISRSIIMAHGGQLWATNNTPLFLVRGNLEKHRILVEAEPNARLPVSGDRVQLQQVLLNLITNAIDSMAAKDEPRVLCVKSDV